MEEKRDEMEEGRAYDLHDLKRIMSYLRGPEGCPWDRIQNHQTLRSSLIEEAYEVLERIEDEDMVGLCEELGDLLLQVVFHARLAEEAGLFTLDDVIHGISSKLIRRHPHVFKDGKAESVGDVLKTWAQIKREEKGEEGREGSPSLLEDVSSRQPSLMWAQEAQKKAAAVGFDWDSIEGAWEKLKEEVEELERELEQREERGLELEEELGDLFFSLVNVSRFLHLSSEMALRQAVKKFIKRFGFVERQVQELEDEWDKIPLIQLEEYWQEAKKNT